MCVKTDAVRVPYKKQNQEYLNGSAKLSSISLCCKTSCCDTWISLLKLFQKRIDVIMDPYLLEINFDFMGQKRKSQT